MKLARAHLTVLLNALYDLDVNSLTVRHPSDEVGELLSVELGDAQASSVRIMSSATYGERRSDVDSAYGSPAVDELPQPRSYISAFLGSGIVEPPNQPAIDEFLQTNGYADLSAGHRPVMAGFDTNLLPWRIADVLALDPGQDAAVNGFALATGVRDELSWDKKRSDTRSIEEAFGSEFEALWNQPAGSRREGRLGENYYRQLRDHRYGDEVPSDTGDEGIIQGYQEYQEDSRKDVLLFSNDRDFIERARAHRILAQRIEIPDQLPRSVECSWTEIQDAIYLLAVLFGVIELPKVTLYGVWQGKSGQAWQDEQLRLDCRSPKVEPLIERDLEIINSRGS